MKNQAGLTLLEVVVSIAALTVILSSLTVATLSSLNNATFSKNQNLATQYAQAALEGVRQANDSDYATFKGYTGSFCYNNCSPFNTNANSCGGSGSSSCKINLPPTFSRYVTIKAGDTVNCGASNGGGTFVTATVAWADGKCTGNTLCQKVMLSSCIAAPAAQTVQ